jgi:hypothetical protein
MWGYTNGGVLLDFPWKKSFGLNILLQRGVFEVIF